MCGGNNNIILLIAVGISIDFHTPNWVMQYTDLLLIKKHT